MDYVLSKFKIKPGKLTEFQHELAEHTSKLDDILEGLRIGQISLQCLFVESTSEGDFLMVFRRVNDENLVQEQISNPSLPSEIRVRKIAETYLEKVSTNHAFTAFDLLDDVDC